jgi:rare lipoprotein A
MKRIIATISMVLGLTALYAAETQTVPGNGPFKQEGIASWYGAEFAGRPTASGEIFTPSQLTAAHPSLPFGTMLRVTNKHNNKQITVRVNDRGPFVSARIIDVSRAAAEALDMISTGTAPVLVESVGYAGGAANKTELSDMPVPGQTVQPGSAMPAGETVQPAQAPSPNAAAVLAGQTGVPARINPALPPGENGKLYRVQVGSYKMARNAVDAFDKLKNAGFNPAYEKYEDFFRVVLAGIRAEEVGSVAEKLGAAGFREALIREER